MVRTAGELHRRAIESVIHGRHAAAQRALNSALSLTDDPNLRARIAGTQAVILQRTGSPELAQELCREALALKGLTSHTAAVLRGQLGAIAMYDGRWDEADRLLTRAVDHLIDDEVAAARVRVNRSLANLQRRRLPEAMADLVIAVDVLHRSELFTEEAQARHNLGYAALLGGDLVRALDEMRRARPLAASSPVAEAVGDVDRAEVLRDAGLPTEAERILSAAARTFGSRRMPQSRGEAELSLARSLLGHDPTRARTVACLAALRLRAVGSEAWAARADSVRLRAELATARTAATGSRQRLSRRPPDAVEVLDAIAGLRRHGLVGDAAGLQLSWELWRSRVLGDPAGPAIRLPLATPMDVRLLAHEVRSARAAASGDEVAARRHAAHGLEDLSTWQQSFGSLDLQTSVSMLGTGLIFSGLESAVRSRRPAIVFEWSERARHLSQQVVPLRPPPDSRLAADLAELRMLRASDTGWLTDPRAVELCDRARSRQWSATGSKSVEQRSSLGELQNALDDDTGLVAYVYSGDRLSVLVATTRGARLEEVTGWPEIQRMLPGLRADLNVSAAVRTGAMAAVIRRSLHERLARLSALLLDDVLAAAGTRRVILTVPGVLTGIPWAMLPGMRGRVFTVAQSATKWVLGRAAETAHHDAPRVGFVVGPRIARGAEEVGVAKSAWRSARTLRGEAATVADVTRLASRVDVLHVAAHGRHAVDNPLFSGVELADGILFGYDIDLVPELPATVVLSACEVGRSSVRWGEEAIGMTRIWLHAGARCVIASPVVVADDDACELLGAMHEGLAAGEPPSEALAAASARTGIVAPFQAHGAGF